jgi:SAM-dependent methyltransferase
MTDTSETSMSGAEFWDARYRERDRIWSGNANTILVREISDMAPGRALDLGCGEGADALWLARRGWQVTAVDISGVALDRGAEQASAAGLADRIDWQRHDLATSFPQGVFDLVSAQFLHSRGDLPREEILRSAAAAVAEGGVLLVVGHSGHASWEHDPHNDVQLPSPQQVLASLELPTGQWEVQLCEEHERHQAGPDGQPTTRTDNVVKVRRVSG